MPTGDTFCSNFLRNENLNFEVLQWSKINSHLFFILSSLCDVTSHNAYTLKPNLTKGLNGAFFTTLFVKNDEIFVKSAADFEESAHRRYNFKHKLYLGCM